MNKQIVAGFVSVKSILESHSREVYRILLEKERFDSVMRSTLRAAERRQYEMLLSCGVPVTYLSLEEFTETVQGSTAGGIAAEVGERQFRSLEELLSKKNGYFAILDGIEDPFNFGYALRSLYAAGVDGVILPERNFFTATETVVRSSAGASELLPCCTVPDLAEACATIKSQGIKLVSTAKNDKAKDVFHTNFRRPLCVIYGGERRGISAGVMEQCDAVVKIKYPRNCHYSLPACSAISILSFEIGRKLNEYKR
ncbi:MAG: RNA methyltransferase [Clostridia bacterium]|nr:RNA methyltransferase [Clostridia bacterium]